MFDTLVYAVGAALPLSLLAMIFFAALGKGLRPTTPPDPAQDAQQDTSAHKDPKRPRHESD